MFFTFLFGNIMGQTVDTVRWDVRDTAYYYWGNEWFDSVYWNSTDSLMIFLFESGYNYYSNYLRTILARPCYTEHRLDVVGIAAAVHTRLYGPNIPTFPRGAEYFRLYQDTDSGMALLKTVRWDTLTPRKVIGFYADHVSVDYAWEYNDKGQWVCIFSDEISFPRTFYIPIYEAYFDSAITVHDTFYVAGTALSNIPGTPTAYAFVALVPFDAPLSGYVPASDYFVHPNIDFLLRKRYSPEVGITDTSNWERLSEHGWLAIFPILSYPPGWGEEHPEDTLECTAPLGLRVLDVAHDTVSLTWLTNSAANRWELWLRRDSAEADSGLWVQTTSPVCQFDGLDTAQWYEVRVRALCDSTHTSDWSDSIRFYLPGWEPDDPDDPDNPDDSVAVHSPVEQFTYVAPNPAAGMVTVASSFRLERVELYSLKGTLVTAADAEGELALTLDVSRIPAGVYMLRVHTPAGTAIKRLVVK